MFNVNNIQIEKNDKITNKALTNLAIKKGFNQLITKILLKKDIDKLSDLNFSKINQLVTYYQITNVPNKKNNNELVNFNIAFDKEKIHDLFYKKEFFILKFQIMNYMFYLF